MLGLGLTLLGTIAAACALLSWGLAFVTGKSMAPLLAATGSGGLILFALLMLLFRVPDAD